MIMKPSVEAGKSGYQSWLFRWQSFKPHFKPLVLKTVDSTEQFTQYLMHQLTGIACSVSTALMT